MSDEQVPPTDPLDLDAVDRAIRLNELEERVLVSGMEAINGENCPPGV